MAYSALPSPVTANGKVSFTLPGTAGGSVSVRLKAAGSTPAGLASTAAVDGPAAIPVLYKPTNAQRNYAGFFQDEGDHLRTDSFAAFTFVGGKSSYPLQYWSNLPDAAPAQGNSIGVLNVKVDGVPFASFVPPTDSNGLQEVTLPGLPLTGAGPGGKPLIELIDSAHSEPSTHQFSTWVGVKDTSPVTFVVPSVPDADVLLIGDSITTGQYSTNAGLDGFAGRFRECFLAEFGTSVAVSLRTCGSMSLYIEYGAATDMNVRQAIMESLLAYKRSTSAGKITLIMEHQRNDRWQRNVSAAAFQEYAADFVTRFYNTFPAGSVLYWITCFDFPGDATKVAETRQILADIKAQDPRLRLIPGDSILTQAEIAAGDGVHPAPQYSKLGGERLFDFVKADFGGAPTSAPTGYLLNPDFTNGETNWTRFGDGSTGFTVSGGVLHMANTGGGFFYQYISQMVVGQTYRVHMNVLSLTADAGSGLNFFINPDNEPGMFDKVYDTPGYRYADFVFRGTDQGFGIRAVGGGNVVADIDFVQISPV
ncbi:SGNH/GDSL hydrolase family protein [Hymenobacter sp. 15J16-1T3B]|uniref:SGNH/GDSL hydrolase family protein n=1 Tax=Hymenobacter sp. 15J16-1T3B TaxID=2886941 RepID=UPI001D1160F5|nr:SGNH/GDSL hydrolase family protein [Hymenobacter sp. 15J16-1T3B]MCC3159669.1 SGNH/GDSL hydrolase family protein [Hymenobacter sp. 15J16-1T3B]